MNRSKLAIGLLASCLSLTAAFFIGAEASACVNTGGDGADSCVGETAPTNTGNSASRNSYTGVFASWDTGIQTQTVTSPNQAFSFPEIKYGNTTIPAITIYSGDAAVGSEMDFYMVYAENPGYVYIDGVRTYVKAGTALGCIPAAGLKREDGTTSAAWDIYHSSGKWGDKPISEAIAYLQQLEANGQLSVQDLLTRYNWGGKKDLSSLSEEEVKKIIEEICDGVCDSSTPSNPPSISSCHVGSHAGWTEGQVQVKNFTTGIGWTNEVWARPGDTVRFSMYYCWGVGAVGGSADNDPSTPKAIYPDGNAVA